MRRFLIPVLLTLLFAPAFAQTPAPAPGVLPTFTVLSGTAVRDATSHRIVGNFSIGYGKDVSTRQRAYAVATFWSTPETSGGSGGAAYDLIAWDNDKGWRLVFGADGEVAVGGIDTSMVGITKVGLERYTKSLRGDLFIASVTPINPGPTGDQVKQIALNLRLAFLTK